MSNRLNITRSQLASFLNNDADLIRRFEELILEVGETFPDELESVAISLASEGAKNNSGLSDVGEKLDRLSSALEALPPKVQVTKERDNLIPPATFFLDFEDDIKPIESNNQNEEERPHAKRISSIPSISVVTANVGQAIAFTVAKDEVKGMTVQSSSRIKADSGGYYRFDAIINVVTGAVAGFKNTWVWFKVNGVSKLPATRIKMDVSLRQGVSIFTHEELNADDYVELFFASNSTDVSLDTTTGGAAPEVAAAMLTISKIN